VPGWGRVGRDGRRAGLTIGGNGVEPRRRAAILPALAAFVLILAGCAASPSPNPSTDPSAGAPSAGSLAPDTCPIAQPPGPGDEPAAGGDTTSDLAGGRAAACLVGPPPVDWEASAWCAWTPDRLAVDAVSGLPTQPEGDDATWDVFLDLRRSELQVSRTASDGTITTWTQVDVPAVIRDDGAEGLATFDAGLAADSPPPPTGIPPRVAGVVRWQCADPPPA
jgi:hypothetical protein